MNNIAVVDGHSDYPIQVFRERQRGKKRVIERKHLPSCTKGGVVMEVVTVGGDFANSEWDGRNPDTVLKTLDYIHQEVAESPDFLRLVLRKSDLLKVGETGTLSMMLNLEGASCVTSDFSFLQTYYRLGVRAISLTHNNRNIFADGCAEKSGNGLSYLGKRLIKEINKYNMVLDLVHINKRSFFQALDLTERPVVVSHSNAKKICNSFRNLTDDQLKALADRGGVVGLNCLGFLIDDSFENQTVNRLLDHLDYIVELIGIDHVGFGPDYINYMMDLVMENLNGSNLFPGDLQYAIEADSVSFMQKIVKGLVIRGYKKEDIRKIMAQNFVRVYMEGLPE